MFDHDLKPTPKTTLEVCQQLQSLQRRREIVLKSRNMQANRIQAIVAGTIGYSSGLGEKEREAKFTEASDVIERIRDGEDHPFADVVLNTFIGIDAFEHAKDGYEKEMEAAVKLLPVYAWTTTPDLRGFGALSLAKVIGECGDLCNFANPAKVWRRMGCAPHSFGGKTLMGSTWRFGKEGKLPPEEWETYGYSPRRRSLAFLIGEGIVKQNGEGPYRKHYDAKKAHFLSNRPEWTTCTKCAGKGKVAKVGVAKAKPTACGNCKGGGTVAKRCHMTAMLCATKMLFRDLWIEWHRLAGTLPPKPTF